MSRSAPWPHAPPHFCSERGIYMVTAGTYEKAHFFIGAERLSFLQYSLLELAAKYGWILQAWAVFPNHYHFIAIAPEEPNLKAFLQHLHSVTARHVNALDNTAGRKVWHNYWDSHITFERSHYARLKYVNENAVHHGIVKTATEYPWCSARWFERVASASYYNTVNSFKTDLLKLKDDY